MKLSISRDQLLKPLQQVCGVVEKRQTLPVLANVLLVVDAGKLSLTGTDLEVELVAKAELNGEFGDGEITVPARKLLDICKSLPASAEIELRMDGQKLVLKSGKSRFTLTTLPANEFPNLEEGIGAFSFTISQKALRKLIEKTSFAMAQQDVRYYLNGMLFEVTGNRLRTVSTDGHRLAMCDAEARTDSSDRMQVIVPRKGVHELARLLTEDDGEVTLTLGTNHIRATVGNVSFTSKLIDGKFPDYERVLPKGGDKIVLANREELRQSLQRASILSNEKYRGIRLQLTPDLLRLQANNPDQEEAEEDVTVEYAGASLEIGFNVQYLMDVLGVLETSTAKITLGDSNSSALLQDADSAAALYVVMPMRL
ncbi:MAG: dnaN [Moraxellaceae bacterium]|jgi:DNA polymerase-3 subunit beta|nr:dnaN [Moraxellaceae bacterium]